MFFLVLFLIAYSIEYIPVLIIDMNIASYHPRLLLLPVHNDWILYPLFFIYIQKISIFQKEKIKYWPVYPGIVYFVFSVYLYVFLPDSKIEHYTKSMHLIIICLGLCYSLGILWLTNTYISKHISEVNIQYSSVEEKELRWAKKFVTISSLIVVANIILIVYWVYMDFTQAGFFKVLRFIFSCIYVFVVYWLSYRVITQQNVQSILLGNDDVGAEDKVIRENFSQLDDLKNLVQKIDGYLIESKSYTKQNLTLLDISEALDVHHRNISIAINKVKNKNFSAYINDFRVEMAKGMLQKDSYNKMSIDGIGLESGFQSKSAFYTWFKRLNGITPSEYRMNIIARKTKLYS